MYSIRITMSPGLERLFSQYPQLYMKATKTATDRGLDLLRLTSRNKAYANNKTGIGTMRKEIIADYPKKSLFAGTDSSYAYARIQDIGGTITGKTKMMKFGNKYGTYFKESNKLRWKSKDGKWHMADKVTIKPKHYFFKNAVEQQDKVLNEFVKSFKDIFARV